MSKMVFFLVVVFASIAYAAKEFDFPGESVQQQEEQEYYSMNGTIVRILPGKYIVRFDGEAVTSEFRVANGLKAGVEIDLWESQERTIKGVVQHELKPISGYTVGYTTFRSPGAMFCVIVVLPLPLEDIQIGDRITFGLPVACE